MIHEEETPEYNPFNNLTDRKEVGKPGFDCEAINVKTEVDLTMPIEHPPVAISIGEYDYNGKMYPIPFGSYGDISCIVGASKSKKTFFKSAIISGYIGGYSNNYFSNIIGHEARGKIILDIDTEQSKFHSQRVFKRVQKMTGVNDVFYKCYSLRELSAPERLKFIDWLINEKYNGQIGLISIDGYADLVSDFNNIDQAQELVSKLMKWSSEQNCHITGILHRNFGTQKPVGHVGSFILKKCETVVFIENDAENGTTTAKCEYGRNIPFDDITFAINNHLPMQVNVQNQLTNDNSAPF